MNVVLVALFGALGAVARYGLDGVLRTRVAGRFPLPTVVINVSGSLLLGVLTGLALHHGLPARPRLALGTGFCGGYTTFSTASYEAVLLQRQGAPALAAAAALGTLAATVLAAAAGIGLAGL